MRTMQGVHLIALDTGEATVNGAKEARLRSNRGTNREMGTGMILLGAMSNTGETLEIADGTLDKQKAK